MYITAVGFTMIFAGVNIYGAAESKYYDLEGDYKSSTILFFAGGLIISLSWVSKIIIITNFIMFTLFIRIITNFTKMEILLNLASSIII